jgi:hypothetical protein
MKRELDQAKRFERVRQWADDKSKQAGHKVGLSRRELLSHGFWASAATVLMPSIPLLWAKDARAADCGGGTSNNTLPFITFDMAGGAGLHGNVLVGKQGGPNDLLASYDLCGWDPRASAAIDARFGLPMSAKYSKLLAGMLSVMSPAAQANFRMGSVCHFSQLDTTSNKLNIAALVAAAGGNGSIVDKGFGTRQSASGGNSDPLTAFPTLTPVAAKSVDDIVGAARFGGTSLSTLTPAHRSEIATRARDISAMQREALKSGRNGQLLYDLSGCVYDKDLAYASGGETALDPRLDTAAQAVFGINAQTAATSNDALMAGVIVNAISGKSGPGIWTLGDCDYHTGEQTKGDTQDNAMGVAIGRAVEYANRIQKPFFFHLLTDGSLSPNRGTRNWSQDTNEGMSLFGYYLPTGVPKYVHDGQMQIGAFTDGQTVDRSTAVGSAARLGALAVFANYCNVANKMAAFDQLAPNSFPADVLKQLLVFQGQGT